MWREIARRISYLGRRSQFDRELEEEVQFHIATRARELEQSGLSPDRALTQARREFGPAARVREDTRSAWQFQWIEDLFTDLRQALRSFRRSPAFALTAIACLALGIGANTLIFSLVNAFLLRTLPYPDADRLVMVRFTPPNQLDQRFGTNSGSYFTIREHNHVFERMGALRITGFSVAADSGENSAREWVLGGWVSPGLTDVMGTQPIIGRWFSGGDTDFNVVISYGMWQRLYGGTASVLGRKLDLDNARATVVGVMPPGYQTLNPGIEFWRLQPDENLANARRSPNRVFNLFARLRPGVTVKQAQAEMATMTAPLVEENAQFNQGWGIKVETLQEAYLGYLRRPLLIFQGAVLFLLAIACANVAGLLLAQASARQKELSLRAALGSSRTRAMRQLLAETGLLSVLGGALGVAFAWIGLRALASMGPAILPGSGDVTLDGTVVAFAFLLSLASGVVFGVLPAIQVSRPNLMEVLRESSRSSTASGARQRLRGAFVVIQVSLALVLLTGAALMTNSLLRLNIVRAGFEPRGLITFQVPLSRRLIGGSGNTPAGGLQIEMSPKMDLLSGQIRDRLARLPGVESAAIAMTPPLGGEPRRFSFTRDGQLLAPSEKEAWSAEWYPVSEGYFHTLKVPLIRGREFAARDSDTAQPVAMINAALAQRFFANENPIGKRIQTSVLYDQPREIVGVVGNVRQNRYQYDEQPQMYVPRSQLPRKMDMTLSLEVLVATFIVRASGDPAALAPALRAATAEVDRGDAVTNVRTVEEYASEQLRELRQYVTLLGILGGASVLLAVVGLFGVMAQTVSQRTNELGIRRALGAPNGTVLLNVIQRGVVLIAIGLALGFGASLALTHVIRNLLWGITATDPATFLAVGAGMSFIALLACLLPARRALRIDPVTALRSE